MRLSPRELEKLRLHNAGYLAQKRLARGLRLNYPEAIALLVTQLLEMIRDGQHSVAELMDIGRQVSDTCYFSLLYFYLHISQKILGRREVMAGVGELLDEVQIEGTFLDGTKVMN